MYSLFYNVSPQSSRFYAQNCTFIHSMLKLLTELGTNLSNYSSMIDIHPACLEYLAAAHSHRST